jgi:hypothetical protein
MWILRVLLVDMLSVAYPQNKDQQNIIFDPGNNAKVSCSIPPIFSELWTFERIANVSGVF